MSRLHGRWEPGIASEEAQVKMTKIVKKGTNLQQDLDEVASYAFKEGTPNFYGLALVGGPQQQPIQITTKPILRPDTTAQTKINWT